VLSLALSAGGSAPDETITMITFSFSGFTFDRAARLTAAVLQIVTLTSSAPQLLQRQIHDLLADEIADIERRVAAEREQP
jgi:hypothetical protein